MRKSIYVHTLILCVSASFAFAEVLKTQENKVDVEKVVENLYAPWAVAIINSNEFLVTERDGVLFHYMNGVRQEVKNVPKVFDEGQGGLLDVVLARDFEKSREVFITYAKPKGRVAGTALGVAKLSKGGSELLEFRILFEQNIKTKSGRHFGSRVVEAKNGDLFLTVGDRGDRDQAQNPNQANGKVVRVFRKGGFEYHSLGHRNPQGASLDLTGQLWTVEHGPKGGDEINRPEKGQNYGWPLISYGKHYSGGKVGLGTTKEGLEQPKYYWDPSIAPSGMMIYSGKMFPNWKGDVFVGSLKFNYISRLKRSTGTMAEVEQLLKGKFDRIRDIREAPDGSIWFLAVGDGALYRISATH